MGGLLPFFETEELGTDFLDFRKVLFVQLEPSFPDAFCLVCWAASEGPVEAVVSVSSASNSFHTLEGVAPSLELLVATLLPRFLSLGRGGPFTVEAAVSASSASNSFHTLEGVAPSLELLVAALLPRFLSLWGILTLRP